VPADRRNVCTAGKFPIAAAWTPRHRLARDKAPAFRNRNAAFALKGCARHFRRMEEEPMKRSTRAAVAASMLVLVAGAAAANDQTRKSGATDAQSVIESWPAESKKAAQKMIQKYGQPDEVTASLVMWNDNGPWKKTLVYKQEVDHRFPAPHKDVLQQFVDYQVPPDKFDELAMYDGSVIAERTKGELSARCDMEEANILALNLADEVITGKRGVEDARKFYGEQIMLLKQGQSSPYLSKLRFDMHQRTADADKPLAMKQASAEQ
jgi:hypothetical protein